MGPMDWPKNLSMKIIGDTEENKLVIEEVIQKYGYAPEHNFFHFRNWQGEGTRNFLFQFDKGAILARQEDEVWYLFSEILAPPTDKIKILSEFLAHCFSDKKTDRVSVEFETDFRAEVLSFLKSSPWRACAVNYSLTWPIFDLAKWDPELSGGDWKKLRYQIGLFYRQHKVEIVDGRDCKPNDLEKIVEAWRKKRQGGDRSYDYHYLNLIDNNFAGVKFCRVFIVDGAPATITAGWEILNQQGSYYSAVGLHNYSCDYLGEAANVDDLSFLKKQGYQWANFGGGEEELTGFKMKFHPCRNYDTHVFSIKRR